MAPRYPKMDPNMAKDGATYWKVVEVEGKRAQVQKPLKNLRKIKFFTGPAPPEKIKMSPTCPKLAPRSTPHEAKMAPSSA